MGVCICGVRYINITIISMERCFLKLKKCSVFGVVISQVQPGPLQTKSAGQQKEPNLIVGRVNIKE